MNHKIIYIFIWLFVIALICSLGAGISSAIFQYEFSYLALAGASPAFNPVNPPVVAVLAFFTHLILFNTIIPISLYVTIEMIKVVCSAYIGWDLMMYVDDGWWMMDDG